MHVESAAIGSQCSQDCLFQPRLTYSGKQKTYPRRAVVGPGYTYHAKSILSKSHFFVVEPQWLRLGPLWTAKVSSFIIITCRQICGRRPFLKSLASSRWLDGWDCVFHLHPPPPQHPPLQSVHLQSVHLQSLLSHQLLLLWSNMMIVDLCADVCKSRCR